MLLPTRLVIEEPWLFVPLAIVGLLLLIFGLWLWIGAGRRVDGFIRKGILADRGFYGLVRNPIYTGILFTLTGLAAISRSTAVLGVIPFIYLFLKLLLTIEEQDMAQRFGEAYAVYARRVRQILPKPVAFVSAFFYPGETGNVAPGILALQDRDVNAFVISDGKHLIAIDAGYGGKAFEKALDQLGVDPSRVSAVFLTHTDIDHQGGLGIFPKARLYMGREEMPLVNGERRRHPFFANRRIARECTLLDDGRVIEIGNLAIRAIAVPGHTPGHTAYLLNETHLFSGDSVLIQNGGIIPFYRPLSMDHGKTVASAGKIRELAAGKTLITAHSGWKGC